jgi:hypothetical protein
LEFFIQNIIITSSDQSIRTSIFTSKQPKQTHFTPRFASSIASNTTNQNKQNNFAMAASQVSQQSGASASHRSLKNVAQKAVAAVKQHNKEVNAAFQAFYGVNSYPGSAQSAGSSRKSSATSQQ